ncbi:pre-rRNA-processing protein esf1 [Dimargaris cristalligena]|nr:pre-rRNA-processing protein esf1 [Dimargaris cristalligena]
MADKKKDDTRKPNHQKGKNGKPNGGKNPSASNGDGKGKAAGPRVLKSGAIGMKGDRNDSRFNRVMYDSRFDRPSKNSLKVKVDERFSRMLKDKDFTSVAKFDKYGREVHVNREKGMLRRFYNMDAFEKGQSESDDDASDDDDDADNPAVSGEYDPARGIGLVSSSEESDLEVPEEEEQEAEPIPLGEPTKRFAVLQMDWSHVKCRDLFKVFTTVKPTGGSILSVKIYPSEFGKQRMAKEAVSGPQMGKSRLSGSDVEESDVSEEESEEEEAVLEESEEEGIPQEVAGESDQDSDGSEDSDTGDLFPRSLFTENDGQEVDHNAARQYEVDKRNFYYGVVECDSVVTAQVIYEHCDGVEFEESGLTFDLRYIPDETQFNEADVKDGVTKGDEHYVPGSLSSGNLRHSRIKVNWDEDDPERVRAMRRTFTKEDVEAMDFSAYLASDHSDDSSEDDDDDEIDNSGLVAGSSDSDGDDNAGDARKSTVPAPKSKKSALKGRSKSKKLREKYLALLQNKTSTSFLDDDGSDGDVDQEMQITFKPAMNEMEPDFKADGGEEAKENETTLEAYRRKHLERKMRRKTEMAATGEDDESSEDEDPKKSRARKAALEEAEQQREQANLDLLLMDEEANDERHFDMNEIVKSEKRKGRRRRKTPGKNKAEELRDLQEDFKINVGDSRFSAVHESHMFAIDPTNPRFKKTKAMGELLSERQKRLRTLNADE